MLVIVIGSVVNIIGDTYKILQEETQPSHYTKEIYVSSTNYEENGYALDLNLVIIFDESHVWYYERSGLMKQPLKTCIPSAFKRNG